MMMMRWSALAAALSLLTATNSVVAYGPKTESQKKEERFIHCILAIEEADTDKDDRLSRHEYQPFVQFLSTLMFDEVIIEKDELPREIGHMFPQLIEASGAPKGSKSVDIFGARMDELNVISQDRLEDLHALCKMVMKELAMLGPQTNAPIQLMDLLSTETQEEFEEEEEEAAATDEDKMSPQDWEYEYAIEELTTEMISVHSSFVISNMHSLSPKEIDISHTGVLHSAYVDFIDTLLDNVCASGRPCPSDAELKAIAEEERIALWKQMHAKDTPEEQEEELEEELEEEAEEKEKEEEEEEEAIEEEKKALHEHVGHNVDEENQDRHGHTKSEREAHDKAEREAHDKKQQEQDDGFELVTVPDNATQAEAASAEQESGGILSYNFGSSDSEEEAANETATAGLTSPSASGTEEEDTPDDQEDGVPPEKEGGGGILSYIFGSSDREANDKKQQEQDAKGEDEEAADTDTKSAREHHQKKVEEARAKVDAHNEEQQAIEEKDVQVEEDQGTALGAARNAPSAVTPEEEEELRKKKETADATYKAMLESAMNGGKRGRELLLLPRDERRLCSDHHHMRKLREFMCGAEANNARRKLVKAAQVADAELYEVKEHECPLGVKRHSYNINGVVPLCATVYAHYDVIVSAETGVSINEIEHNFVASSKDAISEGMMEQSLRTVDPEDESTFEILGSGKYRYPHENSHHMAGEAPTKHAGQDTKVHHPHVGHDHVGHDHVGHDNAVEPDHDPKEKHEHVNKEKLEEEQKAHDMKAEEAYQAMLQSAMNGGHRRLRRQ